MCLYLQQNLSMRELRQFKNIIILVKALKFALRVIWQEIKMKQLMSNLINVFSADEIFA